MLTNGSTGKAHLQIWGKGFLVSEDHVEFQRCVPQGKEDMTLFEAQLESVRWGSVLEPLYGNSDRDLAGQFCVLFGLDEMMSISLASTIDKHKRPSLVLVAASVRSTPDQQAQTGLLPMTVSLSLRLAGAYSKTFEGNPAQVQQQLKGNTFLPTRSFDLIDELPDRRQDWGKLIESVQQWKGIRGIATPRLVGLGANVVVGTRHESEKAIKQTPLDGYMDVRTYEIHPLTSELSLSQPASSIPSGENSVEEQRSNNTDILDLKDSVARLEGRVDTLLDLVKGVVHLLERAQIRRRK